MVPHGFEKPGYRLKMRSPDVYKALDPPEFCMNRASRPCRHTMKPHRVVAALDPRDTTIPSTPATFVVHIRFLGACPKGGLRSSNHLESGIRRDLQSFGRPALAAA